MGLLQYLNADYVRAANQLKGGRRRIVAYVESYDDIAFWSQILRQYETPDRYFEVMLPSRSSLAKGKKMALANKLGPEMIACVDADYDWLLAQIGVVPFPTTTYFAKSESGSSQRYLLHTFAYAIENHQCYAPGLHEVCVKTTLNDTHVFPFADFLQQYSESVWPLFVWNVWAYASGHYKDFSLRDFARVVTAEKINYRAAHRFLSKVQQEVKVKVGHLQREFPNAQSEVDSIAQRLQQIGVTPSTTYLHMRGHDLMDGVVLPLLESVCGLLRNQREREIQSLAVHARQKQNELSAYHHACGCLSDVIRKHSAYSSSPLYQRIVESASRLFE